LGYTGKPSRARKQIRLQQGGRELTSHSPPPYRPAASSAKKQTAPAAAPASSAKKAAPASSAKKAAGPTDAENREIVNELVTLLKENPGHVLLLVPEEMFTEIVDDEPTAKPAKAKAAPKGVKKAVKKPAPKKAAVKKPSRK
jgi:hypothetical protein